jgi:hypothetical protein
MKPLCVSVCKNTIASNLKRGENRPVIRCSEGLHGKPWRQHTLSRVGKIEMKRGRAPWGARVWLEISPLP